MNTGWSDCDPIKKEKDQIRLHDTEAQWAEVLLKDKNKKSILLSHHWSISNLDTTNAALWFAGHLHRLIIYKNNLRIVGAGAVPELINKNKYSDTDYIHTDNDGVAYLHSFAIMDIDKERIKVSYFDENNQLLYSEDK